LHLRASFFHQLSTSQSYQTLISSFFRFSLLSVAISKYRQYFLMQQILKLNNKKRKKIFILGRKKFGRINSSSIFSFKQHLSLSWGRRGVIGCGLNIVSFVCFLSLKCCRSTIFAMEVQKFPSNTSIV
jgi:hypothetical protein